MTLIEWRHLGNRKYSALFIMAAVTLSGCNIEGKIKQESGSSQSEISNQSSDGNPGGSGVADSSDNEEGSSGSGDSSTSDDNDPMPQSFADNGNVENGLTHWGTTAGQLTEAMDTARTGNTSALISNRTATWHGLTFDVGVLTEGNEYQVSVWVKLASGSYDTTVALTAKRENDSDNSTYKEYTGVVSATVNANEWTQLTGYYTHSGTDFEHFIIEATGDANVSYYADDFTIIGEVTEIETPPVTEGFYVGNITTAGAVRSDFIQYWNQLTPENEGKWGSVESTRDIYNWSGLDAAYQYAKRHGIPFKQHTFVWGSQYPNWISSLPASEQAAEIEQWIADYCARYPDTQMIDVVNEATLGHAPAEFAKSAFGDDWIIKSFQLARQYCPNAELILNDYNVLSWHTDAFISMAKPAVQAGVVDAIGLQAHSLETFTASQLKAALDRLASELKLPIYISEYDVAETDDQKQLTIYQAQFPVFYQHASVKGITLWGYVTGRTWREGTGLISEGGTPRPAMIWLMDYINANPKQ